MRRRIAFGTLLAAMVLGGLEIFSWAAVTVLERTTRFRFQKTDDRLEEVRAGARELIEGRPNSLVRLDDEIGWIYRPEYRGNLYNSNSWGARGKREYEDRPEQNKLRIAAFGDSFVHGNEVSDDESWSSRLEALDSGIEVVNFGVGGFGTDQALLLFRRVASQAQPDVVLLGFSEVNLARNVNRYRRFLSPGERPLFKPRFLLREQALELLPAPFKGVDGMRSIERDPHRLVEAAPHDFYYEPLEWENPLYDHSALVRLLSTLGARSWRSQVSPNRLYQADQARPESEAFRITVALVREFAKEAEIAGYGFVFLIFPTADADIWGGLPPSYAPLQQTLADLPSYDAASALRDDPAITPATMWAPQVHYSSASNATVARLVRDLVEAPGSAR